MKKLSLLKINGITKGFSLLEILIVVALISSLSAVSVGMYRNFSKNVELESAAKNIVYDLRSIRAKAMSGENGLKWGIHFINGNDDYYELFSTATDYSSSTVQISAFLPGIVSFSNPPEASSTDIIFNKISGTTTSTSIIIFAESDSKTITITSQGNIY